MKFSTSNKDKIQEFLSMLPDLEIVKGPDLKEVDGTKDEVIVHKAKDAGEGFVVEDTILEINGEEVVDIRWKVDSLNEGDVATWYTSLGYNDGTKIHVYRGVINGFITRTRETKGFAFDPYLVPDDLKEDFENGKIATLAELKEAGLKNNYSARFNALQKLLDKEAEFSVYLQDIEPWSGEYQND